MASVVKWLRPRIVVPICMGSNPIRRPILSLKSVLFVRIFIIYLSKRIAMSRLSERIENFNKSFQIFSEAVKEYKEHKINVLTHMALIQSFEICFELAWKILKDYLALNGVKVFLPKEVIKEAFANEVIPDGQVWIDMLDARNSTSHEYNLEKVSLILDKVSTIYFKELDRFSQQIKDFYE